MFLNYKRVILCIGIGFLFLWTSGNILCFILSIVFVVLMYLFKDAQTEKEFYRIRTEANVSATVDNQFDLAMKTELEVSGYTSDTYQTYVDFKEDLMAAGLYDKVYTMQVFDHVNKNELIDWQSIVNQTVLNNKQQKKFIHDLDKKQVIK